MYETTDDIFLTILKVAVPLIILLWITIEYYNYVPRDNKRTYIELENNKEGFQNLETIYRQIPNYTDDEDGITNKMDDSILRNVYINKDHVLSKRQGLDYYQMNHLVNRITKKNNNRMKDSTKKILSELKPMVMDKKTQEIIENEPLKSLPLKNDINRKNIKFLLATTIALLNTELLANQHARDKKRSKGELDSKKTKLDMLTPYHKFEPLTIRNYHLISHNTFNYTVGGTNNTATRYIINIRVGRDNRQNHFVLQLDCVVLNSNSIHINKKDLAIKHLVIVGLPMERVIDEVSDTRGKLSTKIANPMIDTRDMKFYDINQKITVEPETIDDILLERKRKGVYGAIEGDAKCFHPRAKSDEYGRLVEYDNRLDCESYHPEVDGVGVWDAPCQSNDDCPYYQANKNYPNEFGRCLESGYCEMPIGVENVGYTKEYKMSKAMCHNCNTTDLALSSNECCKEQTSNKKMDTPDYMFVGDTMERKKYKEMLNVKGLKVGGNL